MLSASDGTNNRSSVPAPSSITHPSRLEARNKSGSLVVPSSSAKVFNASLGSGVTDMLQRRQPSSLEGATGCTWQMSYCRRGEQLMKMICCLNQFIHGWGFFHLVMACSFSLQIHLAQLWHKGTSRWKTETSSTKFFGLFFWWGLWRIPLHVDELALHDVFICEKGLIYLFNDIRLWHSGSNYSKIKIPKPPRSFTLCQGWMNL